MDWKLQPSLEALHPPVHLTQEDPGHGQLADPALEVQRDREADLEAHLD